MDKMVYATIIQIRHEEGASFSRTSSSTMDKLKFMLEYHVKGRDMLLNDFKENEDDQDEYDESDSDLS